MSDVGTNTEKVNEMLPIGQLSVLGLQHVLAMYAGAVTIPIIIAGALGLTQTQLALLIAADLFTCGIATFIQSYGIGNFAGIKLPVVLGVTFTAVGPLIAIGSESGILGIWGSIIISGLFMILFAPLYGKIIKVFPPGCYRFNCNNYRLFIDTHRHAKCGRRSWQPDFWSSCKFMSGFIGNVYYYGRK